MQLFIGNQSNLVTFITEKYFNEIDIEPFI